MIQKTLSIKIGIVIFVLASLTFTVFSQEIDYERMKQELNEKGIKQLIENIKNDPPQLKAIKIKMLGMLKDPRLIKPIADKFLKEESEDEQVRSTAAHALGEINDQTAVKPLINALKKDKSELVRLNVLEALGKIATPEALQHIDNLLKNEANDRLRASAARALGNFSDPGAVKSLMAGLKDRNSEVCLEARRSLVTIGKPAVPSLIVALETDEDDQVRIHAASALGDIGLSGAIDPLLSALRDDNPDVFKEAAAALGKMDSQKAIGSLVNDFCNMKSASIQRRAEEALVLMGKPAVDPLIKLLLSSQITTIRNKAVETLMKIGEPATAAMVTALGHKDKDVRRAIAAALEISHWKPENQEEKAAYYIAVEKWDELEALGDSSVEPLIAVLEDKDPVFVKRVMKILGETASPKIVEPLLRIVVGHKESEIRMLAKAYLVKVESPKAIESLISAASLPSYTSGNQEVINWALTALYKLKDPRAIHIYRKMSAGSTEAAKILLEWGKPEEIIQGIEEETGGSKFALVRWLGTLKNPQLVPLIVDHFLKDQKMDNQVRSSAAMALGKIEDDNAIDPLIECLKNDKDGLVRMCAAEALGEIGSPIAVDPLIAVLNNDVDARVRKGAAIALGQIKDLKALDPLLTARKNDSNNEVKYRAGLALLEMKHPRATDFYIEILSSNNPDMRLKAATILLVFKDPKAIKARGQAIKVIDSDSYITEIANYDEYGRPASFTLKNVAGEEIAKKMFTFNQYNPTQKSGEIITDLTTGNDIHVTVYDEHLDPKNRMWLCLDEKGNIIKRAGKPLIVKLFNAQQKSEFEIVYDGAFIDKRITKIYPCLNCAGQTGIKNCRYVW